jgi:hypothetical protein
MLRRYPNTLRWRQALPPLFVISLTSLVVLSILIPLAGLILAAELLLYSFIMLLAGLYAAIQQRNASLIVGLPLSIFAMHIAWGGGFLWSMLTAGKNG